MTNTDAVTIEVGGAQLTVSTQELFKARMDKHFAIDAGHPIANFPQPREGEKYVGGIIEPDGHIRHIYLLPGDNDASNWSAQMKWTESIGGRLPDRVEQALLHKYMLDEFKKEAYWSGEQHVSYSDYAWDQYFGDGSQGYGHKGNGYRARAVRS